MSVCNYRVDFYFYFGMAQCIDQVYVDSETWFIYLLKVNKNTAVPVKSTYIYKFITNKQKKIQH